MEFQIAEAIELIKTLAETENLTQSQALTAFVAEAELDVEYASILKAALFEEYTLQEMASDSMTKALYNVFVSGAEAEDIQEMDTKETQEGTKYKVRVKDRASGSTYSRYATRAKIAELRANPNIASVELSDYGTTGEDDRGEKTAAAKGGGMDRDGDGKVESSSKEHAGVVHNAIQRKMGGTPDGKDTRKEEVEVEEGIDFKGARRIDDAREKAQAEKDKKNPSGKDRRLMLHKFRPGASKEERAEGGRDSMREKGTSPKKDGKKMFEAYLELRAQKAAELEEMRHRDAETGEVTDKPEIGRTYYTDGPRQKSSVALRKEKEAAAKKKELGKQDQKEEWKPDPKEKREKKAKALHDREQVAIAQKGTKYETPKTEDPDALYKRRQAIQSKTKMRKEDFVMEADLVDAGRENQTQRDKKKLSGNGVDNSREVRLMPYVDESVVTENGLTSAQKRLLESGKNLDLRSQIKSLFAEECCDKCGTPECTCESKKEDKKDKKKSVKIDESGMPILEYSRNNARPGPSPEMINPGKDPEGDVGHMNPKGKPKRYKNRGEAPGDRRPNDPTGPELPFDKGTVPNGSGV